MYIWEIEELILHKDIPEFIIYHIRIIKSIERSLQFLIENKAFEIEKRTHDLKYKMQENRYNF